MNAPVPSLAEVYEAGLRPCHTRSNGKNAVLIFVEKEETALLYLIRGDEMASKRFTTGYSDCGNFAHSALAQVDDYLRRFYHV